MSRNQKDYLADLLKNDETESNGNIETKIAADAPSPFAPHLRTPRTGITLLERESALARVASGEVRQVTQMLLNPARVRIWAGNARIQSQLSEASCRDLIDSIRAEGGQKVPVVVRRIENDGAHDFELIVGTRRHFAISWLRVNAYPDMKLLAHVVDIDDEAAFRLADIENRARKDISDIERARNYADAVLAAFSDLHALTLNPAYALASALDAPPRAHAIHTEAAAIVAENKTLLEQNAPPLPATTVLRRLMGAQVENTIPPLIPTKDFRMDINGAYGRPIVSVKSVTRQGITLHLPMASGAGDDQIANGVKQILDTLRKNGVTVA